MDDIRFNLRLASDFARRYSTCAKVQVGSLITTHDGYGPNVYGRNHGVMDCKKNGCRRIKLYGDNSKSHRLPSDCDALHSEIDAISLAACKGIRLKGATIYVTRYPCEACARAIGEAGIKKVYYGRRETISDYTKLILENYGVEVEQVDWDEEDDNG